MKFKKIFTSNIFVFIYFLLIFYAIFRYSESFNKGYNAIEDWSIINAEQSLDSSSFSSVYDKMMRVELYGYKRIRPMWVLYFLTSVELFGFDLLLLNIYIVFLCIITSFLLFKFCRNIGFSSLQSFLFALLTLIGPATIVYARPPDAEIIGMLMLSLTLYFLSKSIYSKKHQILYKICFVISLLFTSLSKESFLIVIPAVLYLYLWIYSLKNDLGIIKSIKKNYLIIIVSTINSLVILFLIIKFLGINQDRSYSGVNISLFTSKTIFDFIYTVLKTDMFFLILLGIFIFFENELQKNKLNSEYLKKHIKTLFIIFGLISLIIVPQFIIYYKTGFIERYYLPYLIGYSFLLIYILKIIFESKSISSFLKYLYLSTLIIYLFIELSTKTIPSITFFSKECKETTEIVNSIKNNQNDVLLVVMDPAQSSSKANSLKIYMEFLKIRKDFKYDFVKKENINKFFTDTTFYNKSLKYAESLFGNNLIDSEKNNSDIDMILIFYGLNKPFIEKNKHWFKESEFKKKQIFFYTLYYK